MPRLCDFETCRKQASYGEFYGKPLRCNDHKEEYRLVSRLCQEDNCKNFPNYNYEGNTNALYCSKHKMENMIDIKHKKCINFECEKLPSYNYEGEIKAIYCLEHKKELMVNVKDKKCQHIGCKTQPTFNFQGETIPLYCSIHKKEEMIDVRNKKCIHLNCKTHPAFNFQSENIPLYCSIHKKEEMINIISNNCLYPNCKKIPHYNYECQSKCLYCFEHKKENMIDKSNRICIHPNCKKQPSFNYENEYKGLYCSIHKKEQMINVRDKKCNYPDCKTQPTFNFKNKKTGLYCFEHKKEDMIDVKNKKCKANYCLGTSANPKYKGYCSSCYQNLFPNDPLSLQMRSKTKEIAVRDFININFEGFQHDKPLWTGNCDCTHRRRIDHRKLIGNTLLCVETDENQHKNYDEKDEELRYDDLFMLHGGKFIFIRFNPDKFKDKNGKSINPTLYTRLPILKEEIEKQIERIKNEENIELLEIFKLYYNE
jgi:hypothetical protein